MPPVIVNTLDRVKDTVKEFTLAQKTLVIIGVAVLVLGGVVLYSWVGRPSYTVLFSGLTEKDQAAVTQQLDATGIKYQVADNGIVKVPSNDIQRARMDLAANNLPAEPTTGYAVLDNLGVAASDFQQQMAKKRALEGELAKTINSMDVIEKSSVALAIPAETVFADPKKPVATTASVTVEPKKGREVDNNTVQAIVNMVSASIPNLSKGGVSVVDTAGNTLSDKVSAGLAAATETEKSLVAKALAMVEPLVGVGNAKVSAHVELAQETEQKTTRVYTDPEGGVKQLSSSKASENYSGGGAVVGGVLGPDNIGNPYELRNGNGGKYENNQTVNNNAVNEELTNTTRSPGAAMSKTISVVLNQETARRLDMTQVRDSVAAATGIDAARGDVINVSRAPFDDTAQKAREKAAEEAAAAAERAKTTTLIRQAVIAGLIILLLIIIAAVAKKRAKAREREALDLGELDQLPDPYTLTPPEEEALAIEAAEVPEPEPEPEEEPEPEPDPIMLKLEAKREEIAELALDKPQLVAEQLRAWMGGH
ncbi:flagellar M-ring protein FliF [Mobiluncus mulieris]|uniref:Flagellar M-ring protein n=1 Tax=Mobiluncus mulieris TaxID=2052 RepID=A0A7Y0TZD3_9ACTO|nr:flagellar basal-body MS-ring/collar protein FliF [Mobiluncus mulieris]NMW63967.1 flagellar M-ring protein FliF [Mobiluncus mulieris]